MDKCKAAIGVGGDVAAAWGQPIGEVSQGNACVGALPVVVAPIADLFLDDARGIEVGFAADTAIPSSIMPS